MALKDVITRGPDYRRKYDLLLPLFHRTKGGGCGRMNRNQRSTPASVGSPPYPKRHAVLRP